MDLSQLCTSPEGGEIRAAYFPIALYEWIALIITRDDHLRLYGSHTEGP